jgi:DNA-binding GntR family transcriptional regulator
MSVAANTRSGRKGLADRVYEQIREMVVDGQVEPRARLVIDRLAAQLGVSHTPLREAFGRLEADGLICKVTNGYVSAPALNPAQLLQLWEARIILEPAAAELATTRADDAVLEALAAAHERFVSLPGGAAYAEYRPVADADGEFHALIVNAADNEFLAAHMARLRPHQHAVRFYSRAGAPGLPATRSEHAAILDAISSRNATAAAAAMRAHLEQSRARMFERFDPQYRPSVEP